jgi:hypothetical protein
MARVTAMRALLVAGLLLGACGDGDRPEEPTPVAPVAPPLRWVTTDFAGLRISIPETWKDDAWVRAASEVHFFGPALDGYRPQLQVIWYPSEMPAQRWIEIRLSKLQGDPFKEPLGEGEAAVGPWRAHTAVFRWKASDQREITNIDYYFAGNGHVGMLRGVAPTRRFLELRPLFDAMAARIAYLPEDASGSSDR